MENIDDWSNGRSGKSLTVQMVMAAAEQAFIGQRDLGGQLARAEFLRQVEQGKVMGERMFQEMWRWPGGRARWSSGGGWRKAGWRVRRSSRSRWHIVCFISLIIGNITRH